MKYFWATMKIAIAGSVNIRQAAISGPQSTPCWPKKL